MSLLVYLAAKAMTVMLGVDDRFLPVIVGVTGLVAVIYTSLGGLHAVVITDFLQTVLLLGGGVLVILTITYRMGGVGWFPTEWNPEWDAQPFFSWDPRNTGDGFRYAHDVSDVVCLYRGWRSSVDSTVHGDSRCGCRAKGLGSSANS